MHGPRLVAREDDDDQRPFDERAGDYDLAPIIGRRASETRLVARRPIGPGARRLPPGGGYVRPPEAAPGAPPPGQPFRPSRDLAARREAYYGRANAPLTSSSTAAGSADIPEPAPGKPARMASVGAEEASAWAVPPVSGVPGERRYRDGQRVRHRVFGEGVVVSSQLTRSDEEVAVAFPGQGVKKLMASLAGLEAKV